MLLPGDRVEGLPAEVVVLERLSKHALLLAEFGEPELAHRQVPEFFVEVVAVLHE